MVKNCLLPQWAGLLLLAALPLAARAQQGPSTIRLQPEDLVRGQYNVQHNFYFLPPGKTGENYESAGYFGQHLRPYVQGSPRALAELNHYRSQKIQFLVDRAVLVSSIIVYGSQVLRTTDTKDVQYFNNVQKVAIGGAAVALLGTIFINKNTNEYIKRAVDDYNADVPGAAGSHGFRWQQLQPSGVGLSAAGGRPGLALRWQL